MAKRIEFTVSDEMWEAVERSRGDVPRARWMKRAVELRLMNPYSVVTRATLREEYDKALELEKLRTMDQELGSIKDPRAALDPSDVGLKDRDRPDVPAAKPSRLPPVNKTWAR